MINLRLTLHRTSVFRHTKLDHIGHLSTQVTASYSGNSASTDTHFRQIPRFYVPTPLRDSQPGVLIRLDEVESRHATKTLRLQQGNLIELADGQGSIATAEIASLDKIGALARISRLERFSPSGFQWTIAVACATLKGGRGDWLVEKCVELGAANFIPLLTARSSVIYGANDSDSNSSGNKKRKSSNKKRNNTEDEYEAEETEASGRLGRWQRVATAAMKQSLRAHAMTIQSPFQVPALCEFISQPVVDTALIAVAGAPPLYTVLNQHLETQKHQGDGNSTSAVRQGVLIIGPEGDFTAEEIEALTAAGAQGVGLGDLRLRTETAAIALLSAARLRTSL